MPSFGDKLKQEREAKDVTIEQIALSTGIQRAYLEALENNEFQALPGKAFGKLYIRAYAELLDFDPRPFIEDYDRELQRRRPTPAEPARPESDRPRPVKAAIEQWRQEKLQERGESLHEAEPSEVETTEPPGKESSQSIVPPANHHGVAGTDEPAAVNAGPSRSPGHRRRFVALLAGGLVLGVAVVVAILSTRNGEVERGTTTTVSTVPDEPPPRIASAPSQKPIEAPPPAPKPARTTARESSTHLEVSDFGVGRRIGRGAIDDQADTFAKGAVAYFSTRVLGGKAGDHVRHVWLFEGRVQQTIRLRLGGPRWHTFSSKRLDNTGPWAVEARDQEGRLLARATFTCSVGSP